MFRYRRYRVFVVFAVLTVIALYKFGKTGATWQQAASTAAELKYEAEDALGFGSKSRPPVAHETQKLQLHVSIASGSQQLQTPPPAKQFSTPSPTSAPNTPSSPPKPSIPTPIRPHPHVHPEDRISTPSVAPIYWSKLPEKFPVPANSLIKLPTGKPRPIPQIQFKFQPEDDTYKADRLAKLNRIRSVFKKSWSGYREFAWLHDELRPMSGTFRDPFANWGATLVDALDTLWIMGLRDEFEEAARAVDQIDFKTTPRADIPLFETTIRYLGGLIAAYDISGKKYKNLLVKATELAEVLMGAFDTPNRMPETYYYWRPQFASQKHRAGTRVVLAEIGSLSMEFTRLAQLTGEDKYYDAIARITDHLEEFQNNTRLPGMWPTYLDASGCGRAYTDLPPQEPLKVQDDTVHHSSTPSATPLLSPEGNEYIPLKKPDPIVLRPNGVNPSYARSSKESVRISAVPDRDTLFDWQGHPLEKRQLDVDLSSQIGGDDEESIAPEKTSAAAATRPTPPDCVPQGFKSTSDYGVEEYTLGGMSDSTYEYLPKQYLLLGGQVEKYQTMYEQSADVVKRHLLFRPMLPDETDVLFSGKLNVPSHKDNSRAGDLEGENAHLTCFAGGMFGMAAKMFDRPEDLETAKKLTQGCIWSYDMTPTGIMPESFEVMPCDSITHCTWNETLYWQTLDPQSEYRLTSYKEQMKLYHSQLASASSWYDEQLAAITAPAEFSVNAASPAAQQTPTPNGQPDKRQLADVMEDGLESVGVPSLPIAAKPNHGMEATGMAHAVNMVPTTVRPEKIAPSPSRTLPAFPYVYSPSVPLNHEDFVQNRIQGERLPSGVTKIGARNYILRPEAIESVWYMYRITGERHWREAGWRMFLAIENHTSTTYGNSAIDDVTMVKPTLNDEMESFWLAETLKYFYLLFEHEEVVSLDKWVLNTEAHPFERPL